MVRGHDLIILLFTLVKIITGPLLVALPAVLTAHLIHMYLNTEEKWKLIKGLIQSLLGQRQLCQHLCGALDQAQKEEQRLGMYLSFRIYLEMKENNKRTLEFSTKTVFSTVFLGSSLSLGYNHSVQPFKKTQQILSAC